MTKALSRKEIRAEAAVPKRRAIPIMKAKISIKENDRIARMKAAREAYSKLSKERVTKQTGDSHLVSAASTVNDDVKKADEQQSKTLKSSKLPKDSSPSRGRNSCRINEKTRTKKPTERSHSSESHGFKPMASSLEAIRNGGIRTETGRASYIAGARSLAPRPSLLPLGINIFESNVSFTDKMKVRNFIESRLNTGTTPKKTAPSSLSSISDQNCDVQSARISRTVRFCVGATIEEQRESGADEVLREEHGARGSCDGDASSSSENNVPQSILKKKKIRNAPAPDVASTSPHVLTKCPDKENDPRLTARSCTAEASRHQLSFPSTSAESDVSAFFTPERMVQANKRVSSFVQSYTQLFNMSDDDWKTVEPIMLDELIGHLKEKKTWLDGQAALLPEDTSSSLLSLPEDISKPQTRGFRKVVPRACRAYNADLEANQEVMLINESANNLNPTPTKLIRYALRSRQRDPVSIALGGDSPFCPIRGSPIH